MAPVVAECNVRSSLQEVCVAAEKNFPLFSDIKPRLHQSPIPDQQQVLIYLLDITIELTNQNLYLYSFRISEVIMPTNKPTGGTSSSSASRVRTAWFVVLTSVEGGVVELHLGWKYADNSVGLYSNCSKSSKSRPGWGRISDCKFKNIQDDKGDSWGHFIFKNRYKRKPLNWQNSIQHCGK